MKKIPLLFVFFLVIALAAGLVWWSPNAPEPQNTAPTVAATIFPLYDITRNVAGDALNVELMLPVGASPHTYEPTSSLLRSLQNVSVIYAVGYDLDTWSLTVSESLGADVVLVDNGIVILESRHEEHEDEEEHEGEESDDEHGELDPHYWLAFENAMLITQTIADDLSVRFPESADIFAANATAYLAQLQAAEQEAHRIVTDEVTNVHLITLHDAWYYFADSFDLEIVGSYQPTAGREPTPQYLIELTEAVEYAGVDVLYSEPQLSTQSIESFVQDNNLSIVVLDPLGGSEGTSSYIDMMLSNVRHIANNQ